MTYPIAVQKKILQQVFCDGSGATFVEEGFFWKTLGFGNHRLCRGSLCAFKALV